MCACNYIICMQHAFAACSPKNVHAACRTSAAALTNDLGDVMGACADLEGPQLAVVLDDLVLELAANQALGIEDCMGVGGARHKRPGGNGALPVATTTTAATHRC